MRHLIHRRRHTAAVWLLAAAILHVFLQGVWAHRVPVFTPTEPPVPLLTILNQPERTDVEDELLFVQTGLSPAAVDTLLAQGAQEQILAAQRAVHATGQSVCAALISGRITCQDLLVQDGAPLAPLEPGDLLISFSTHTEGWRHGHAGLVIDGETVLEATKLGSDSARFSAAHWRQYTTLLVLRVRDAPQASRVQAVQFALGRLDGVPYSFLAGLGPTKEPGDGPVRVQCAYLPWCAWQSCGYDLDADGGRIVTVADLAASPLLEVVQVYGLDPSPFFSRAAGRSQLEPAAY